MPWYKKARWWVLIGTVVLLVALRLLMVPIAKHFTQKGLDSMKGYRGSFADLDLSIVRLSYMIEGLKIYELPVSKGEEPLFYSKKIDAHFVWRDLIRFRIRATARVDEPKVVILIQPHKTPKEAAGREIKQKAKEGEMPTAPLSDALQKLIPFKLDRVEVRKGQVLYVDKREADKPDIWVHHIEATLENFGSRKDLNNKEPSTLGLKAVLQRSGKLDLFAAADPFAKGLTFSGEMRLRDFNLRELHDMLSAKTGIKLEKGILDIFASFKCVNGTISGGVKPMLKDADFAAAQPGVGKKIKAWLADVAFDIFSDRVPGREAVATIVPIHGRIDHLDTQVWPAVLGVVRNAFVEGLSESLENVPPPTAPKKEGPFKQARRALSKKATPPVKTQPTEDKKK
jgi:hypothetical protein